MSIVKTLLEDQSEKEPIDRKEKIVKIPRPCARCGGNSINEIVEPPTSLHYSRLYCSDCGKYLQPGQDPQITEASEKRDRQILSLLEEYDLNQKEETFLNDRLYTRFATQRQRDWMDRIRVRCEGEPFDWSAYEKRPSE